ncbi:lysophospholipid acyltransferase family protein [Leifsonia sp. NPDC056665]|uniref:lysophospholipid acyltransferase family protein n=1 Tax=Leifsonia sp. NPDC056665 TaxID=3345901 RepID=UPI003675438F
MPPGAYERDYPRSVSQTAPDDGHEAEDEVLPRPGLTYFIGRRVVAPLLRLIYRPHIIGARNVPRHGKIILASNHLSFIDSLVIPMISPRRVQFLAKSHYFEGTGFKGAVSRSFFTAIGAVGVKRGAGQAAQEALEQSRRIIDTGAAFALYPEGTRSLDGRLYKGRTGIGWLALTTGAKVVPVGLIGTNEVQPVGAKFPRVRRITIAFGEPIDVAHYGPAESGRARRQATDEIMAAIHGLTGQELAGTYNESPPANTVERVKRALRPERL